MKPISRLTMLAAYLVCLATALMTSSPATAATVSRAKRIPVVFSAPSTAIALKGRPGQLCHCARFGSNLRRG